MRLKAPIGAPMDSRKLVPLVQNPVFRDLAVVCASVVLLAYLGATFDFFEFLFDLTRAHEEWELDEVFLVLLVSPIGISWFAYRRWTAERQEGLARRQAESHRDALRKQFGQVQRMETIARLTGKIARDFETITRSLEEEIQRAIRNADDRVALQRSLAIAADAVERAAELTSQLIAFGEKKVLDRHEISVGALIAGVQSRLTSILESRCAVEYLIENDEVRINTDGNEFCQAIVNLASNARDAMPYVWKITITCHCVDDRVEFLIEDTGQGMDQETAARAFEPFFTTKGRGAGHGLGLTMVYGFVLASGGHVDLSSSPRRGTTVRLTFPIAQQAAKDEPSRPAAAVA